MRKSAMVGVLCLFVLTLVVPGELLAQEKKSSKELKLEAKQVEVDEVAEATLKRLFKENARAKELFDAAMAWAVFDNTKIAFGVSGGGGKGVAVEKDSGQRTYMKMGTAGVGFGIGVNKYQVVFFFQDEAIAKSFVEKGWQADAGATAAAGKDAAEAKTNFVNGLAIYQLTEKGLMLNVDIAGTKYWQDKELNDE